jgi:hypothetical protein
MLRKRNNQMAKRRSRQTVNRKSEAALVTNELPRRHVVVSLKAGFLSFLMTVLIRGMKCHLNLRDSVYDQLLTEDEADAESIFCAGLFSEDIEGERWARCNICFKPSHTLCRNLEGVVFVRNICR